MKKRFFFPLFACLLLVFSCASAGIDLTAYEVPVFPIDSIKIIQPGLILTLTDGSLSDGQFPSSVTLLQDGQILFSKAFDDTDEWPLSSLFVMGENCYGYTLAEHGNRFLGVQYVRLTSSGTSPMLQLADSRWVQLMDFGVAFLHTTGDSRAICLLDWQGHLKVDYALNPNMRYTLFGSMLLADGTLRVASLDERTDTPLAITGTDGELLVRTFSTSGQLLSETPVQSPYLGTLSDTVAFDRSGGLVACISSNDTYSSERIIRMDAQNNVLYERTLSAPKTIVHISAAQPSPDGSVTLYGTAMANSRGLFTVFKLDLDAQGNVTTLDIRDFTTRASFYYALCLDAQGNAYAVAEKLNTPFAVVPFEVLPAHDDPGLTLE